MIFCIFDTTVAMMLAWRLKDFSYTEISLLLGVRFSSTKFAQRKNLAKASWQKLFNLVVIRLKFWLWRVFHSVDPLTSKIWFVNLSSICFKFFCEVLKRIWCQIKITLSCNVFIIQRGSSFYFSLFEFWQNMLGFVLSQKSYLHSNSSKTFLTRMNQILTTGK